ncbi:hypothetical protein JL193_01130 [Polaribacter batillariae]|uniref:ATP-binding protein n=1 Tax=Polaribacter batillariae TaxID=2808900 RepID=A0ABX7SWS2_9FLAO|nr:hypothetical protein [Polaribacter batillariae]QTD37941.1 hypothetical protein JL193_01130 [Polaribacter batillariae]
MSKLKKLEDVKLNTIKSKFEKLNQISTELQSKIIVNGFSKTGNHGLFHLIRNKIKEDIFELDSLQNYSESELKTLKTLNSFFLDKNLDKRLDNLDVLKVFNGNFMSDLLILKYKVKNPEQISKLISSIEFSITNLVSKKIVETENILKNIPNIDKIQNFLKFIGNIKELGNAETFEFLLKTMNDYEFLFRNANGKKKIIPDLINSLREYAIIDIEKNSIEIDVASVLTRLLEKHQLNRNTSFYATVGLNQYWTNTPLKDSENKDYDEFSAASEKIGVKFKLWNFDRRYYNEEKLIHDIKKKSLVSDIYAMPYFSGILYKIANTSGKNYDSVNFGVAFGLTFFNSLDLNFSYSIPMEGKVFKNSLLGISFDIPLSEYLKRL